MIKLLSPFRYFLLENKEKQWIDLVPTLSFSAIISAIYIYFGDTNFFGPGGFLSGLSGLTSALAGFYVAALVAAATFNHPDLDVEIKYGPVYLDETDRNDEVHKKALTRRELVCIIFGYLSLSALLFSMYAVFSVSAAHAISIETAKVSIYAKFIISCVMIVLSSIWICHIAIASMLGIYYLMSRLFRHDPKVLTTKANHTRRQKPENPGQE
jgi:hypothetical protein